MSLIVVSAVKSFFFHIIASVLAIIVKGVCLRLLPLVSLNLVPIQRYTYRVLQTIQMKLILLWVWAEHYSEKNSMHIQPYGRPQCFV